MTDLKKLGYKVRELRGLNKLSQVKLAEMVKVDITLISKIENGHIQPTQDQLQAVIEALRLDGKDALDLWNLSGRASGPIFREQNKFENKDIIMSQEKNVTKQPEPQLNVSVNPTATQILYSDAVGVSTSEFGMVFDFAQRVSSTNNANIVARVGVSHEHARKIMEAIANELARNER